MFKDKKYQEITGILVLLSGLITLLALASYGLNDYDLLGRNAPVENLIGPFGALISHFLRTAFGYSSYLLIPIAFLSGWSLLRKGDVLSSLEKIFSLALLLVTTSALIALPYAVNIPQYAGGFIGLYLSGFFRELLGKTGAYLIVIILNLVGLILLGSLSVSALIDSGRSSRRGEELWVRLRGRYDAWRLKRSAPRNNLEEAIHARARGRMPWITKKKIPVQNRMDRFGEVPLTDIPKMLPLVNPVYTGLDVPASDSGGDDVRSLDTLAREEEDYTVTGYRALESRPDETLFVYDGAVRESIAEIMPDEEPVEPEILDAVKVGRIRSLDAEERVDRKGEPLTAVFTEEEEDAPDEVEEDFEKSLNRCGRETAAAVSRRNPVVEDESAGYSEIDKVFFDIPINEEYIIPVNYLDMSATADTESWKNEIRRNSELLVRTLGDFGIESRVVNVNRGPVITLYEMQIAPGIKVNKIVALADDIAMALAASRVRIVAPIPGKSAVGVEVPNLIREMVTMGDIIKSPEYQAQTGRLKVALGEDILGRPVTLDLKKLPHLLIAGATGSGKSVCVNAIISSLVYNYDPNYVRFIMVDPKMVELQLYNGLPHILTPVITEPHVAPKALKWAMFEMERRYRLLAELNTRDIDKYNEKVARHGNERERLPYIVVIMDELADLMMVAAKEIEGYITRIAQKARAVGIHLVLATQRPSVDVITGIIKANFPARIAFQVAQKTDSRTIIDQNGAEKLLGKGDMLYQSPTSSFPVRVQGAFISEDEIIRIVQHLRKMAKPAYIDIEQSLFSSEEEDSDDDFDDALFVEALKIVEETKKASASYLQRRLSIGYNRAARIIELMEDRGYVGPQQGSKPREVFI